MLNEKTHQRSCDVVLCFYFFCDVKHTMNVPAHAAEVRRQVKGLFALTQTPIVIAKAMMPIKRTI